MQYVLFILDVILACLLSRFLLFIAAPWMRDHWCSLSVTEEVVDGPIDLPLSEFDVDIDLSISEEADTNWTLMHPPRANLGDPNLE